MNYAVELVDSLLYKAGAVPLLVKSLELCLQDVRLFKS